MELVQYLIVVGGLEYLAQKTKLLPLQILATASRFVLFFYLLTYFFAVLAMLSSPLTKWAQRSRVEPLVDCLMLVPAGLGSGFLMTQLVTVINTIASNH